MIHDWPDYIDYRFGDITEVTARPKPYSPSRPLGTNGYEYVPDDIVKRHNWKRHNATRARLLKGVPMPHDDPRPPDDDDHDTTIPDDQTPPYDVTTPASVTQDGLIDPDDDVLDTDFDISTGDTWRGDAAEDAR